MAPQIAFLCLLIASPRRCPLWLSQISPQPMRRSSCWSTMSFIYMGSPQTSFWTEACSSSPTYESSSVKPLGYLWVSLLVSTLRLTRTTENGASQSRPQRCFPLCRHQKPRFLEFPTNLDWICPSFRGLWLCFPLREMRLQYRQSRLISGRMLYLLCFAPLTATGTLLTAPGLLHLSISQIKKFGSYLKTFRLKLVPKNSHPASLVLTRLRALLIPLLWM